MNAKLRDEINKALKIDEGILKDGKWVPMGNTGLSFLVRPATIHNKDFQAKLLQDKNHEIFSKIKSNPESIKTDDELRLKFAKLILGTIILDIEKIGVSKEDLGVMDVEDLSWLMIEYEADFSSLLFYTMNRQNFQIIDEIQAKN